MQTDALALAKQSLQNGEAERITWGVVEFQVIDLKRTVDFWTTSFGLIIHQKNQHRAILGTPYKKLFVFHTGALEPVRKGYLGMYHVCIGVADQIEFSNLLTRFIELNIPFSPVDHLMSKSIYVHDPDGFEIEIGLETPERFGRFQDDGGFCMFDSDGNIHNGRETLNIEDELSYAVEEDIYSKLSEDAFISHIHFKVAELSSATSFFEQIGFARNLLLPSFGIADMGAGADYTHRVAMNIWDGENIPPAPKNMSKLTHYELLIHDFDVMNNIKGLEQSDNGLIGQDPIGNNVSLVAAY